MYMHFCSKMQYTKDKINGQMYSHNQPSKQRFDAESKRKESFLVLKGNIYIVITIALDENIFPY